MDRKKEIQEELEGLSPFLSELKSKGDPFEVPTNYFENLTDDIWDKVKPVQETKTQPTVTTGSTWMEQIMQSVAVFFQPRMALSLASVAILVLAGIYVFNNTSVEETVAEAEGLSIEDTSEYLAANLDDFDMDLLIEALDEEDLANLSNFEVEDEMLDKLLEDIDVENLDDLL